MQKIKLSNSNLYTLVDDEDFERVSRYKWRKHKDSRTNYFTVRGSVNSKEVYLHRFILGLDKTKKVVDHIDRNTLNNQKSNLRLVTQRENVLNSYNKFNRYVRIRKFKTTFGVYKLPKEYIGCYKNIEDALLVKDKIIFEILGEKYDKFYYDLDYIKNSKYPTKTKKGEIVGDMSRGIEKPNRQIFDRPSPLELHKLIWSKSTVQIAAVIGCSDKAIEKWTKLNNIPKPPRGFWAKVKANKLEGLYCPLPNK